MVLAATPRPRRRESAGRTGRGAAAAAAWIFRGAVAATPRPRRAWSTPAKAIENGLRRSEFGRPQVNGAFKERMLREIMRVDHCTYLEAYTVLAEMNRFIEAGTFWHKIPYQASIAAAWALGVVGVPRGRLSARPRRRRGADLPPWNIPEASPRLASQNIHVAPRGGAATGPSEYPRFISRRRRDWPLGISTSPRGVAATGPSEYPRRAPRRRRDWPPTRPRPRVKTSKRDRLPAAAATGPTGRHSVGRLS